MVDQHQPLEELAAELEGVLKDAAHPAARLVAVQREIEAHVAHPGVALLVKALYEVADVLVRFDLPSVAEPSAGFGLAMRRRQATEDFDSAFDDALARVHAARREAGRVGLAAAARGAVLGPHVIQLRRELNALHAQVVRAEGLLRNLAHRMAGHPPGRDVFSSATTLARRAKVFEELHECGRSAIDALRDCEEAFAGMLVRLKHELGPTYVEWKRLLAAAAMRAFSPQPIPMELPEAREVHALLQRQVQVACEAACAFENAQVKLEEAVVVLGRRARHLTEAREG